jgi:hypothetical protein
MTHHKKFKDRWCALLIFLISCEYNVVASLSQFETNGVLIVGDSHRGLLVTGETTPL